MDLNFSFLSEHWPAFLSAAWTTLQLSAVGVILGTMFGILFALMRISTNKLLKFLASAYIEIIRGTPMVLQVFMIYYGLTAFGINLPAFMAGIVALTVNSAAYMAEVFRAGIQAIDKGQFEAARSLGMTRGMTLRYVVLPQAFRNMLPAIGNEFIIIIKDSSLVSFIGIGELMNTARILQGSLYRPLEPLLVIAVIYFVITFTLSNLLQMLERKLTKT